MKGERPSIILATSNGTGMGHLARQLAVGLAAIEEARITLFSLSVALPTVTTLGITGEYCPGPDRAWIPQSSWAHYLADRLRFLVEEVEADVVVFDGVAPYRGITLARDRVPDTAFVWFRRGMWQPGVNDGQLWKSGLFDMVIEPGDIAGTADRGPTAKRPDPVRVPPVGLLEVIDRLTRKEAAEQLGIDSHRPTVLLTLGTGRLGDVAGPGEVILDALAEQSDWQICVATSAVATTSVPHGDDPRVIELRGVFPLVRYLGAFDAVVSAAGYNAVHEYIPAEMPTMLVPNRMTRTDDQVGRARFLGAQGLALVPDNETPEELGKLVRLLFDGRRRVSLRDACAALPLDIKTGGAAETADMLVDLAGSHRPKPITLGTRMRRVQDNRKESLKRMLGPEGTNRVRCLLGRPSVKTSGRLRVVAEGAGANTFDPEVRHLIITSDPEVDMLLGDNPVEHVLLEASDSYMSARRLLMDRHYEVISPSRD